MNKEHILKEIQRTAKSNGGIALGKRKFFQETGIKESDWIGKYWARWSDAIRQAGYESNAWNSPIDENVLLEKFISAVREFKRFPTAPEMRMRKRSDTSFPNHKVFNRFGSKKQIAKTVLNYCRTRNGFEDIEDICAKVIEESRRYDKEKNSEAESRAISGFVYMRKSGRLYKIGHTNSIGRRHYELTLQSPIPGKILHQIPTDDPAGIERYWHKRFEMKRKHGEWFDLDSSDISAFKRRRNFM